MSINNIRTVSVPSIGKLQLAASPGTFTPSGEKSDFKAGRLAADGDWVESSMHARLELNLNVGSGTDIDAINQVKDEDVTVRLANGQVYLMSLARVIEPVGVTDGESKLTIESRTSERIT